MTSTPKGKSVDTPAKVTPATAALDDDGFDSELGYLRTLADNVFVRADADIDRYGVLPVFGRMLADLNRPLWRPGEAAS